MGYGEDLAYIHDVGFSAFAGTAAPALLRLIAGAGIERGLVVDLGCGSGIWARELVNAGYDALGVDISAAMLKLSRKRVPAGRFVLASLHRVKLPRCACVTALGECLNYISGVHLSGETLRRTFRRIFQALTPGGLFIFDLAEPARALGPSLKHAQGKDWAVLLDVKSDPEKHSLERRIIAFRKVGNLYRRSEVVHRLQLWPRKVITRELRLAGFRVRVLPGYGKLKFPGGIAGFLARKPA
jgi:SAM-dependent methyltransferase